MCTADRKAAFGDAVFLRLAKPETVWKKTAWNRCETEREDKMDTAHFYLEQGNGEPLLFLHGNGEDSGYFVHQMDVFAEFFHVYAIDTRGHGRTPRGSAPFTISQFADDLKEFMDTHRIERAHILGFSDGGNIALTFAIRYPERVEKLILDGANLDPSGVKREEQEKIEAAYEQALEHEKEGPEAKRKAELLGLMVNDPHIPEEDLAKVTAKTLVIAGTDDMIEEAHTRAIHAGIPGAELVFIEGDHFIAEKNPEAFNRAILGFLTAR